MCVLVCVCVCVLVLGNEKKTRFHAYCGTHHDRNERPNQQLGQMKKLEMF